MDPIEAVRKLTDMVDDPEQGNDPEHAHIEADEIILGVLRHVGEGSVADAFERARTSIAFWYA